MHRVACFTFMLLFTCSATVYAQGNTTNESFNKSKKQLEKIYVDHRFTVYCGEKFDAQKNILLSEGFSTPTHEKRAGKVEWEHMVPAENFGRAFAEWRDGNSQCIDNRGAAFKGRKCAEKTNADYRRMQADMYNLAPAVGAVNALRSNKQYSELPSVAPTFGSCEAKVDGSRFEPPARAKGIAARASLYMDDAYPQFSLSRQQRQLFTAWDKMYPVDKFECVRTKRIEQIQGNENRFVKEPCRKAGLW